MALNLLKSVDAALVLALLAFFAIMALNLLKSVDAALAFLAASFFPQALSANFSKALEEFRAAMRVFLFGDLEMSMANSVMAKRLKYIGFLVMSGASQRALAWSMMSTITTSF